MIRIFKGIYIHFTFFIVCLLTALFGTFGITMMAFLTAFSHEMCHLLVSLMLKENCRGIAVMPYGCKLFTRRVKSPVKEIFIALAGPLFNILMALILKTGPLHDINVAMAIINLFPVLPLDGGRMVNGILTLMTGSFRAIALMKRVSVLGGAALFLIGVIQAFTKGYNLSILTASAFLLFSALGEKDEVMLYADTLTDCDKMKGGMKRGVLIVTKESTSARHIISEIPPGKYAVVAVLGDKGEVKSLLGEDEIKEEIIKGGAMLRLREIT